MFRGLLKKTGSLLPDGTSFDPGRFGDPLAERTEWGPAKAGGTDFRTHRLVAVAPDRLEFQASLGALLRYAMPILVGVGAFGMVFSPAVPDGGSAGWWQSALLLALGSAFAAVGVWMWRSGTVPIVFDRRRGWFWKGRSAPDSGAEQGGMGQTTRLEEIHALQLISEYCRSSKRSYYSYELNLVLADGRRINVVDHGNGTKLRADAATLAEFLGKPVWDAI